MNNNKKWCKEKKADQFDNNYQNLFNYLITTTIFFFRCGVLFMFVTNNRLHDAVRNTGTTYEEAINEAVFYANATVQVQQDNISLKDIDCA